MKMRSWRVSRHGGLEVLERTEIPLSEPGPGEVRVRVEAVGMNHLDLWVRKGVPGHVFPLPLVPGSDSAGKIATFGAGAEKLLEHDGLGVDSPVIVNPGLSCGRCEPCLGGLDPLCRHYRITGESRDGGAAEFITIPAANVVARPPQISPEVGAAIPIPFLTAWTMLVRKCALQAGEIVLIHAGGSGVSMAAIQIAKLMGAVVITTVGAEEKVMQAQALGADHVIQYKKTPFRDEVRKILVKMGKKGCDIALDHVGADTFSESLKCLAWGGKLVTCGATSGSDVTVDLKSIFFKNLSVLGVTMGSKADLFRIVKLVEQGKLRPVIDSVHGFEQLPLAHERLESRKAFGKVILRC